MHRIDTDGHVNNRFVDEDASSFRQATVVDAAWLTSVQEEIVHVIEEAGIALDKSDRSQLFAAIVKIVKANLQTSIRVLFAESDWTKESATGRYTKTITKTTTADTCIAVHDSTGNRILVNIAENDTQITLTAIAPVAGYAVISSSGGE